MTNLPPMGSGPPLVYVPGLDGSGELLFLQERELAERFRLLRIPSRAARHFEYEDLLTDVEAALDSEGIQRATILGESFGGSVALQFALARPHRVERLILVSAFPYFRNRRLLKLGLRITRTFSPAFIFKGKRWLDVPVFALDGVGPSVRGRLARITRRQPPDGFVRRVELVAGYDVRERLAEIDAPTLLIAGERDRLVPAVEAIEMSARLRNATVRILPGVGHACLLDPALSLARVIDEWDAQRSYVRVAEAGR